MSLRVGLIGYGLAGSVFHAPLIAAAEGLELATVVTGNRERADAARRSYPGARIEPRVEDLFERAGEHELIVVASPNDSHARLARRAVELGVPVVVDKPLAPTAEAARDLVERAERAGVLLTVFHNRRWDSDQLTLRRLIEAGELGEVLRYESRFERWRPQARAGAWRQETTPERGGGLLLDLGTHLVDQALVLFGPVRAVYGEIDHRRGGPADDDVFVALEHESGVRSHLWASELAAEPGPRLRVLGSAAAFTVEALDSQEDALRAGARPGDAEPWGLEPESCWGRLWRGEGAAEAVRPAAGEWPRFYAELVAALNSGGPPPVDPRDAVDVLEILEAARSGPTPR
jgi:scyllo-inositol 2-dehydrogenase (NADP+)